MQIDGRPVLFSGSFIFQAGSTVTAFTNPLLVFTAQDEPLITSAATIDVRGVGAGFHATLRNFVANTSMLSNANGNIGDLRIVLTIAATRFAEIDGIPFYTVTCTLAEAA